MINEDRFLKSMARLKGIPGIRLRLVGSDRPVRVPVPENVHVETIGAVDHRQLMEEYSAAHALLLLGPAERGRGWVPSKLEEYKATGRPILSFSAPGGHLEHLIEDTPGAYAASETDPASLDLALRNVRNDAIHQKSFRGERPARSWTEVGTEASVLVANTLTKW
ncbi:MAG: hypothetical protein M5U31_13115 [Acidimicrobiia bacterium]|nr:hypothetical protein [Acidimicrobiia bacterium]